MLVDTIGEDDSEFLVPEQVPERLGDVRVWSDLGHVLFNVKEFTFLN